MSLPLVMMVAVKLSGWARINGVSRQSAWRWLHAGVLAVPARQLATGTILVEAALAAQGRRLVVIDDAEVADDLLRDMVEVLTGFCARLYGRRSAKRRGAVAVEAAGKAA
jgi:predicted site-specific integrase-resolvase